MAALLLTAAAGDLQSFDPRPAFHFTPAAGWMNGAPAPAPAPTLSCALRGIEHSLSPSPRKQREPPFQSTHRPLSWRTRA